jgi:hypothetical protein
MRTLLKSSSKIAAATTTDEVMQYCNKDIVLYDFVSPLRYVGYKAFRDHVRWSFLARRKTLKPIFSASMS